MKMTFGEAVKISWQQEIKQGDPKRIARLALSIPYYWLALHVYVPLRNLLHTKITFTHTKSSGPFRVTITRTRHFPIRGKMT